MVTKAVNKNKLSLSKIFWRVFSICLFAAMFYLLINESSRMKALLENGGVWTPILGILLLALLGPTPVATEPIIILISVSYSPFWGMVIGAIGNTFAMFIEYAVAYKLAEIFDYKKEKKRLPKFLQKIPANNIYFLIIGRMVPGYGSKIISLIAGAEKVDLKLYFWTSFISGIFGAFVISYGGFGLDFLLKLNS
ncbi:hypothetical protein EBU91_00375 [bacterium]|jgi:uncharacterized membrane protein YdjX (TVP38/TMEM64 family)|nr:hypothetical protein [bacterium]